MSPALTPRDYATLSVLYAREGAAIADEELPGLCTKHPTFYDDLSRLVALELVDYERAERKHYLNYDGYDVVEGHSEEAEETVTAVREARAAQPEYQYTIGAFKWLMMGMAAVAALAMLFGRGGGGEPTRAGGLEYTALDSATWQVVREALGAEVDSVGARAPTAARSPIVGRAADTTAGY